MRVSAGVDLQTGIATWLIEAINPVTGLVITNPAQGLLPPNNAEGAGAGFVTYTVEPYATAATGTQISATATVLFNNAAPQTTAPLYLHARFGRSDNAIERVADRLQPQLPGARGTAPTTRAGRASPLSRCTFPKTAAATRSGKTSSQWHLGR